MHTSWIWSFSHDCIYHSSWLQKFLFVAQVTAKLWITTAEYQESHFAKCGVDGVVQQPHSMVVTNHQEF